MQCIHIVFSINNLVCIYFQKIIIRPNIQLNVKKSQTIDIWKNMTVLELATATEIPVGKLCVKLFNIPYRFLIT